MTRLIAALFVAFVLLAHEAQSADNAVDFIIGASTRSPRQFLRSGAPLWAILADGDGYRLTRRIAQVQAFEYRNPIQGNEAFTGQRLIGSEPDRALIHLAGSLDLVEGPIILDKHDHVLVDYTFGEERTASTPLTFKVGDRMFRVVSEVGRADRGYLSLRVLFEEGRWRQELVANIEATDPFVKVVWIGDIDRDGVPDLLLSVRLHHSVVSHQLYLSSFAKAGQLTGHVGSVDESLD